MRSLFLLFLLLSGCATFAAQSPTPANYLDVRGLEQPGACERHYVIVFASQNDLKQPRYSHTWMTAARVVPRPAGTPPYVEHHTISWMPRTLEVEPARLTIEPGVNLPLHKTITDVALKNREQITMWGPYEVRPAFYTRLLVQKQFLERGQVGYQCVDNLGEAALTGKGFNCIHAITDMDPEHGRRQYPSLRYGFASGREIVRRFRELDILVQPERTHDFLIADLGLSAYPITRGSVEEVLAPSRTPLIGNR